MCECMASKHQLVGNCVACGRVMCAQEGAGPCLFCGEGEVGDATAGVLARLTYTCVHTVERGWIMSKLLAREESTVAYLCKELTLYMLLLCLSPVGVLEDTKEGGGGG